MVLCFMVLCPQGTYLSAASRPPTLSRCGSCEGRFGNHSCRFWFVSLLFFAEFFEVVVFFIVPRRSLGMRWNLQRTEHAAAVWLRQGITPGRLAVTLALGFAIGCVPVVGAPTLLCAGLAIALRLNLPAIQAANYAAMPFQLALILPFVRLGGHFHLFDRSAGPAATGMLPLSLNLLHIPPAQIAQQFAGFAGQAMIGWLLVALPVVPLISMALTFMLRRIPAIAQSNTQPQS